MEFICFWRSNFWVRYWGTERFAIALHEFELFFPCWISIYPQKTYHKFSINAFFWNRSTRFYETIENIDVKAISNDIYRIMDEMKWSKKLVWKMLPSNDFFFILFFTKCSSLQSGSTTNVFLWNWYKQRVKGTDVDEKRRNILKNGFLIKFGDWNEWTIQY